MAKPVTIKAAALPPPPSKAEAKGYEWEGALADSLGIPYSPAVKKFFDGWHTADLSNATNNPFNITVDYTGTATGDLAGNPAKVKNFPTPVAGITATAKFIQTNTPTLITYLKSGDFKGAANYIGQSGWDGGPHAAASVKQGYANSIYSNFTNGAYTVGNNAPNTLSPKDKATVAAAAAADAAAAEAANPQYVAATTDLSVVKAQALVAAKATAHVNDPWVTVIKKGDRVVGFGESTGANAPKNVLTIGGLPATKSLYQQQWDSTYANDFLAYNGHQASPAEQAAILESGTDIWTLRQQWANAPGFKASPIYRANGAGIVQAAKDKLGKPPPPDFVAKAIAQNWDSATFDANLRALPQYQNGPVFKKQLTDAQNVYTSIYGAPSADDHTWLKSAALAGWDQNTIATKLRADPAYKFSGEYEANTMGMLDRLGLLIGAQPALSPVKVPAQVRNPPAGKLAPTVLGLKPTLQGGVPSAG